MNCFSLCQILASLLLIVVAVFAAYEFYSQYDQPNEPQEAPPTCGYKSCPPTSPVKLNVHLVAHSHDDVGWLKTVDQYYYGTRRFENPAGVQFILDSVIQSLVLDESKRFVYAEMSFFSKWWNEQDEPTKRTVRKLVHEGRLEFINGGWCMNDEATVTYQSTIEQMTIGLSFLKEQFGSCAHPKVGWQIDPFGHTSEQASLFAQFGFDGMYFSRISQMDKNHRILNKSLDLIWHGDRIQRGQAGSIFTNIFRDGYDSPPGFCYDVYCQDNHVVDNKDSFEYNIEQKSKDFIKWAKIYATTKLTNHLLVPIGGDFHYTSANQNFKSMDKLIRYINANASDIHLFYSTPSCYQNSVHRATNKKSILLPEKYSDFLPYESSNTIWWTGFYSSRPSVKLVERIVANVLPVARLISLVHLVKQPTGANWSAQYEDHEGRCLMPLWEVLGDLQHHDAITGTQRQHVANDYVRRSSVALAKCATFLGDLSHKKSLEIEGQNETKLAPTVLGQAHFCPLLNISQCEPLENATGTSESVLLTIYNPLDKPVPAFDVRIPCIGPCDLDKVRVVRVSTNEAVKLTRIPILPIIKLLPFRESKASFDLQFYGSIPALGFAKFVVEDKNMVESRDTTPAPETQVLEDNPTPKPPSNIASYEYIRVNMGHQHRDGQANGGEVIIKFDMSSGTIVSLERVEDGSVMSIDQNFGFYFPANTLAQPGAYTFRPNTSEPVLLEKPESYTMYRRSDGTLFEIHQKWSDWIWQTIRVDATKNYIEFDYVVGPIPSAISREVVTRYSTSVKNKGVFLTDSNARQLMVRHRKRSNVPEHLGGSFYPVVSTIVLKDLAQSNSTIDSVSVLVDRAQAGSSLGEGQIELLVHRRTLQDDNWGVAEGLNEPGDDRRGLVVRGKHRLFVDFRENPNLAPVEHQAKVFELPATPKANLRHEKIYAIYPELEDKNSPVEPKTYVVHDEIYSELRQEFVKLAFKPVMTFEGLPASASDFIKTLATAKVELENELTMLNVSLPDNVHLLTLQPWREEGSTLIRLENLDNPLTLHPFPDIESFRSMLRYYTAISGIQEVAPDGDHCKDEMRPRVEVNIEYLIRQVRIVSIEELNLGADLHLKDERRLDWTGESSSRSNCDGKLSRTSISLAPRQIRTFLAKLERVVE